MNNLLFSYGTLQLESVQLASFNRLLNGSSVRLFKFKTQDLKIENEDVLAKSNQEVHPIAIYTNDESDYIEGMVFEVSEEELAQADSYEVDDYKRVQVTLETGQKAWAYIDRSCSFPE